MSRPTDGPCAVYFIKHRDTDEMLYIGISNDPNGRIAIHHYNHAHWTHEPYEVAVEWYDNRADARAAEAFAIDLHAPRDNKQHRPTGPRRRAS